jgi:hypothetical protein
MIATLFRVEVEKVLGRRVVWITCGAIALAIVAAGYGLLAIASATADADNDIAIGGGDGFAAAIAALYFTVVVTAAVIGARAGAYDQETGLFRYWAMTGVPRISLFSVRAPAAATIVFVTAIPAAILAIVLALVLPTNGGPDLSWGEVGQDIWWLLLAAVFWTALSVAIGALLGGSGGAIAIALVVALLGDQLVSLLGLIDDSLGAIALSNALSVLRGTESAEGSVLVAVVVALAWALIPLAAAALRVERTEY